MAQFNINAFTSYILEESEERSGKLLNAQQKMVIQNMLAEASAERLALDFDILNPGKFCQDEAFLKGKIQLLQYMLDASAAEEEAITSEATDAANQS